MANSESKSLAVDVIARIDKLEKGLARASQVTNRQTAAIERRVKTMSTRIDASLTKVGGKAFGAIAEGRLLR